MPDVQEASGEILARIVAGAILEVGTIPVGIIPVDTILAGDILAVVVAITDK